MSVLGVISCGILELEMAHIIGEDNAVKSISIIDDVYSSNFIGSLEEHNKPLIRIQSVSEFSDYDPEDLNVLVRIMRVGLHENITMLRNAITDAASEMGPHVNAIMLGYGLCGNATAELDTIAEAAGVPVFISKDAGTTVDDCVCMVIGGRENYHEELMKCAGTFFMTPGFSRHWKNILYRQDYEKYSPEMLMRMFKDYKRSLILPTEVLSATEIMDNTSEFNERFKLAIEHRQGTLDVIRRTWEEAKAAI